MSSEKEIADESIAPLKTTGFDTRIPIPNDDDFEERVEWQLDRGLAPVPGETRDSTLIFFRETDVRNYLCWLMLKTSFDKTVYLSIHVRRVVRYAPKEKKE